MPRAEAGQPREGGNAIYKICPSLLVGTGSEGQIFQINPQQEETVVLAKVEEAKQVMTMLPAGGRIMLGLANTGGISAMTEGYATEGTYTSAVLDAQQVSRFGKMQLHGSLPQGTALKVQTRSGNISEPNDKFWSKWTAPVGAQEFLNVEAPAARFLQYRLTFTDADGTKTPVVDDVSVAYQLPNLAPVIKSIKLGGEEESEPNGQQANSIANLAQQAQSNGNGTTQANSHVQPITWEASDPNNDALVYSLYFRNGSRSPWILLKDKIKETTYEWNTRGVGDGRYEIKVVASDDEANAPGTGRETSRVSDPVIVDNTPPTISGLKTSSGAGDVKVDFSASDRTSTMAAFAYAVDSSDEWQSVLPSDKIADSLDEAVSFVIKGLKPGTHQVAVRATDAKGNTDVATVNVTVDAPAKP